MAMNEACCPVGPGGNVTIVNQDEAMILAQSIGSVPVRMADLGMEDDSHVVIGFRDADVAGS